MLSPEEAERRRVEQAKKKDEETLKRAKQLHAMRSLVKYIGEYKTAVFLAWLFVAIEVACEVLIPYFSKFIIDIINPSQAEVVAGYNTADHLGELGMYAGIMIGLALISCTGGILAGFFAAKAAAGFGKHLRRAMYYRVQTFSFSNIDRFSTGSLVTRLTTDVSNVQNSVQMILRTVVRAPGMMIFALIMASLRSWQLSLVFLAVIPFLAFVLFGVAIKVHPTFVKVFNAYDGLNNSVQENLEGIRVVKSFTREDFEGEKFGRVSYFIYRSFLKAERLLALNQPAMQISVYACMLVIAYFGARMVVASGNNEALGLTTGDLTSLFSYVMQILNALMFVSMAFVMITIARNSAERVAEVLKEESDIASPENPIETVEDGSVDFNHVSFRYFADAKKDVLHDIDIHIPSGSTVGIIGSTGSSKTTLISMIARLYDVNEGSVCVGGHNVKEYDLVALRDAVAVVLQKNTLFTGTIRSNLLWGNPNATQEQIEHAAKLACADEFIEQMPDKYETPIDQGGTNVSGGQRQRLCIARALLKSPKILILDDSTSAVDTRTDGKIREAFRNEIPHVTKFIVAQRVLSIKDCDLILVMDDGKIIAQGTNDELMKSSDVYRELCQTQLRGGDFDAEDAR